ASNVLDQLFNSVKDTLNHYSESEWDGIVNRVVDVKGFLEDLKLLKKHLMKIERILLSFTR
ncbi:MAG: hypothetical protein ACTSYR_06010, partial [Candidatus Odinarchaeia archaeon]